MPSKNKNRLQTPPKVKTSTTTAAMATASNGHKMDQVDLIDKALGECNGLQDWIADVLAEVKNIKDKGENSKSSKTIEKLNANKKINQQNKLNKYSKQTTNKSNVQRSSGNGNGNGVGGSVGSSGVENGSAVLSPSNNNSNKNKNSTSSSGSGNNKIKGKPTTSNLSTSSTTLIKAMSSLKLQTPSSVKLLKQQPQQPQQQQQNHNQSNQSSSPHKNQNKASKIKTFKKTATSKLNKNVHKKSNNRFVDSDTSSNSSNSSSSLNISLKAFENLNETLKKKEMKKEKESTDTKNNEAQAETETASPLLDVEALSLIGRSSQECLASYSKVNKRYLEVKRSMDSLMVDLNRVSTIMNRQRNVFHGGLLTSSSKTQVCHH